MTPEQKRIAIAEACGWKMHDHPDCLVKKHGWISRDWKTWVMSPFNKLEMFTKIPDYLNDLNAMHEAEKVLTEPQFQTYLDWLDISCGSELELSAMIDGPAFGFSLVHATASQRADAFLHTIEKL